MIGWLIALAVVATLACLPLGVSALYNTDGPMIRVIIGPVRFTVFPRKKKEQNSKTKNQAQPKKRKAASQKQEPSKKGGSYTDFLPLVRTVLDFLGACHRRLRVKRLELKLIMAGGDPAALAINYGRAWAAVGNLMPHLERLFVIKKRDVEVEVDFTAQTTLVYARLDITITLGRLLALSVFHGSRALRQFINITNQRKGGANT